MGNYSFTELVIFRNVSVLISVGWHFLFRCFSPPFLPIDPFLQLLKFWFVTLGIAIAAAVRKCVTLSICFYFLLFSIKIFKLYFIVRLPFSVELLEARNTFAHSCLHFSILGIKFHPAGYTSLVACLMLRVLFNYT